MKYNLVKTLFPIGFLLVFTVMSAQNTSHNGLSAGDLKKIERAEKKIKKAESIVEKQEKYTSQVEALENNNSSRVGKIERLKTKANGVVMQSSSYYKEGFGIKYKAYKKAVGRELKQGNLDGASLKLKELAHKAYKTGRKWRRKSEGQKDVNRGVDYLYKANGIEGDAIKSLIKALDGLGDQYNTITENTEPVQDSVVAIQDSMEVLTAPMAEIQEADSVASDEVVLVNDSLTTASMVSDSIVTDSIDAATIVVPEINEEVVSEPELEVKEMSTYFSIQFLAEKQPVPKEKITSLYGGTHEVIKHESDGWYRYSFGKFGSLEEAKSELGKSGTKGYVVAYHNNKRISTREAVELMAGE